jgi:hypothetical protein
MGLTMKEKTRFLQKYVHEQYRDWFAKDPENIVGVHIGKKGHGVKNKQRYKIIFHVVEKRMKSSLSPEQLIPKSFAIVFPDKKARRITTAVEPTGKFSFQFAVGSQIKNYTTGKEGSLGPFLTDGITAYMSTNFHVAAWNLMQSNQFFFNINNGDGPDELNIDNENCSLSFGSFGGTLDMALIEVGQAGDFNNSLSDGNVISNKVIPDPNLIEPPFYTYCPITHPSGFTVNLVSNDMPFNTLFNDVTLQHAIAFDRYSNPGDSGSPVLNGNFQIVGILVGADNSYSYVIPFLTIIDFTAQFFKSLKII